MKHIRYLTNKTPLCEDPSLLGKDFIVIDYEGHTTSCRECTALLFTHNAKAAEEDRVWYELVKNYNQDQDDNPIAVARGMLMGLAISSGFWFLIGLFIWAAWFR